VESEVVRTAISALLRARHAFEEALDPACTLIAIDLLLAVGRSAQFDRRTRPPQGPTVKELFAQVPHSNRGARIHFNRLVAEGFLIVEPGPHDRRTRLVRLTARGEQVLRKAAAALLQSLEEPPTQEIAPFRSLALRRSARPSPETQAPAGSPPSVSS
jgi:hypothetical protein